MLNVSFGSASCQLLLFNFKFLLPYWGLDEMLKIFFILLYLSNTVYAHCDKFPRPVLVIRPLKKETLGSDFKAKRT